MFDVAASAGDTLVSLFLAHARAKPGAPALRTKRGGAWEALAWGEWDRRARAVAAELIAAGVAKGDRVAIFASTREEWVIADVGVMLAGAVTVPMYPTLSGEQAALILRDAGARVLFAEDAAAVARIAEHDAAVIAGLARVVPLTRGLAEMIADGQRRGDAEVDARAAAVTPSDLATILYTSGTTGEPKGVMLTHESFAFETAAIAAALDLRESDEQLLFLPMGHIFARIIVALQLRVGCVTAFAESLVKMFDNAAEVYPTVIGCVPRLYEKIFAVTNEKVMEEGDIKQGVFDWAIGIGRDVARARERGQRVSRLLKMQHHYADKLVLSKVRARFGRRLRVAISGGAPLAPELAEWFHGCGVAVLEAYGLTETCGAVTLNTPRAYRFGAVGRALPGVDVKLARDGEVLVRGPVVTRGYFGKEAETRELFDAEGFLRTGDIGAFDAAGYLTITDRKKDIIVTAGGKNVAPQRIESRLTRSPWIGQAMVYGDRRPCLVALVTLNADAMARFAAENARVFDLEALARDPEVRARVDLEVAAVNRNLSPFETIKAYAILPRELTVERGELTPTLKIKRKAVADAHRALLDSLYDP